MGVQNVFKLFEIDASITEASNWLPNFWKTGYEHMQQEMEMYKTFSDNQSDALQIRFHKQFDQICASNSMNAGF